MRRGWSGVVSAVGSVLITASSAVEFLGFLNGLRDEPHAGQVFAWKRTNTAAPKFSERR
jgi:hypothetical protein